jgi:NAD(P)H-flavin reductase
LLELARGDFQAKAGQFVMVAPLSPLSHGPRPFAVFRMDNKSLFLLVKAVGENTRLLSASRKGDAVKIIGPCGKPFEILPGIDSYFLVSGGTGLAAQRLPAEELRNARIKITFYMGGKDPSQIVKEKEFRKCGCVKTICEKGGKVEGLVTNLLEKGLKKDNGKSAILACGPKPMLKAVYSSLKMATNARLCSKKW